MPSDEHVRRLARELVLPDEADLVVQRPKYWTPEFCWLYFDRCDELIAEVPADGLVAAEVCPELVYLTQTVTRKPQDRLHVWALGVLGSAYRATDDLHESDETFEEAFRKFSRSDLVRKCDLANLLFRVAVLRSFQHRYDRATKLATRSVRLYRETSEDVRRRRLGEALAARGYIYHMSDNLALAMQDWAEAIRCTDVRLTPRVFHAVAHNLAYGMTQGVVPSGDLSQIEVYVTQASRYFSGRPLSVPKLKVQWLRAMIMMRFGSTRRGEALYRKVIRGFMKLGNIVDMALVSVTLGKHLFHEGRLGELQELAIETSGTCGRLCKDELVERAVYIWKEAALAKTVSAEVFQTTWQVLERSSFASATHVRPEARASALKVSSVKPQRRGSHQER